MSKPRWITFSVGGKELFAMTITGLMSGEIRETINLLAYENGIESSEIVVGTR